MASIVKNPNTITHDPELGSNPWLSELDDDFQRFMNLKWNWDGYGGTKVSSSTIERTKKLLEILYNPDIKCPLVSPHGKGSINLEWFYPDYELMAYINESGEIECCLENTKSENDSSRFEEFESENIEECVFKLKKWFLKTRFPLQIATIFDEII